MVMSRTAVLSIAAAATVLAASPLATTASAAAPASLPYLAVIDAGSSGTRLTLYANTSGTLRPHEAFVAPTTSRGLSSFELTPQQAGPVSISPLLAQLDTYLVQNGVSISSVPVSVLATAGMRDVRRDDPAAAQAILDSTAQTMAASGHPVTDNRILPGEQEASLAWLDTNVLAGTLDRDNASVGTLEVGGASAQVAFRSPTSQGKAVTHVRVNGKNIPVVAVSYLGLGSNDARDVMQAANDAGSFCFPNNPVGNTPVVYVTKAARPVDASTAMYSWARCAHAYDSVITSIGSLRNSSAQVPPSQLRTLPGFTRTRFMGLGNIPLIFTTLGVAKVTDERAALRAKVPATCTGSNAWTRSAALYPTSLASFADTLCSTSTYEYQLVFGAKGVGIQPQNFTVLDPNAPQQPSWTSGYATTRFHP